MAESKSSKRNKKRRAGERKNASPDHHLLAVEEDVPVYIADTHDPISDLKRQIKEAKAAEEHTKTQELRSKLWKLQDALAIGKASPDTPKTDILSTMDLLSQDTDPTEKKLVRLQKKLKQIQSLKTKQAKGEKLEANQVAKIDTESELLLEISILEGLLTGAPII